MWIYTLVLGFLVMSTLEGKRNALQDYQRTDSLKLVVSSQEMSHMTKSRKVPMARCARACSRNKRLPFPCRAFLYDHKNRKCQWLSFDRNSPGIQALQNFNFDLYQKKDYVRECIVGTGQSYRGRRSVTVDGVMCQAWSSPIPHEHKFMSRRFRKKDLRENYCRNPDNSTQCGIPQCSQVECMTCNGEDYRGPMDHTETGKECQRWDLEEPHKHLYHPKRYPDRGLDDNYCRNPDGRQRPWCFTTDPQTPWEYCHIKTCDTPPKQKVEETSECSEGRGEGYRGTVDTTPTGLTCQRWDSQYPHNHSFVPEAYTCKVPWCFTTDPRVRTMLCTHIPQCGAHNKPLNDCYEGFGENYQGDLTRTRSNLPCAPGATTPTGEIPQNTIPLGELSSVGCFIHKRPRIVGGNPVSITEGSWMVSIQKGSMHWCGGSLIREEWVLTDQQCFSSCVPDLSEYRVWLGISSVEEGAPDCPHTTCQARSPCRLSPHHPAACGRLLYPRGTMCRMYGWGETKGTGHDEVLKAVSLPIVSNERCQNLHKGNLQINTNKICAGGRKNEGVCERDYGGPLVCQDGDIRVIVGVSVHGRGCARTNQPAIFINVPFYAQWIYKVFKHYPNPELV
ncbi:hypothetical protein WMY93_024145 [Mugilogobius chulae]|uniref:Scatter factor n=1 Tax=Mugilogobius chulae TaxID=88201 RepID=A0AAW0NAM1_9GOBI